MEYHQVTINEWLEMKDWLRKELNNIRHSYVVVGYILRTMDETKAYEAEGYKSVAEFALKEHGLKPSTTSRWISINREFSLGGYDKTLDPKYADMNASQLIEMLGLPIEDRSLVTVGTSREDIRAMKRFNRDSERETEPASGAEKAFCDMLDKEKEIAGRVRKAIMSGHTDAEHMAAAVAPSGSKMYRAGTQFLAFKASGITVKTFGGGQESLDWSEFTAAAVNWFEKQEGGNDIDANGKGIEGGGSDSDGRDPGETGTDGGRIPQGRDRKDAEGNSRHDASDSGDFEDGAGTDYSESLGNVCGDQRGGNGNTTKEDDIPVSCEELQGDSDGGEADREDEKAHDLANDRMPDETPHDIPGRPQEPEEESGDEGGMNPPEDPVAPAQFEQDSAVSKDQDGDTEPEESQTIVDEDGKPAPDDYEEGHKKRVIEVIEKTNELIGEIEVNIDQHHWPEADEGAGESQDGADQDDVGGNGDDGEDDETVEGDEAEAAEEVYADDSEQEAAPDEGQEEEHEGSVNPVDSSEIAPAKDPEEESRKKAAREDAMRDVREVCWKSIEKLMNDFNSRNTAEAVKQCRRTLNYLESLQRIEEEG